MRKRFDTRLFNIVIPILLLLTIAGAVIYGSNSTWNYTVDRMKTSLREQVVIQSENLHERIDERFALLEGLAAAFSEADIENISDVRGKLSRFVENTDYISVNFIYPDGTAYRNDGETMDLSDRWYFKECLEGRNAVEYLESGRLGSEERIGVAVPIMIDERVCGVLVGDYNRDLFNNVLETTVNHISNLYFLCDANGKIYAASESARALLENSEISEDASIFAIFEGLAVDVRIGEQLASDMEAGESGELNYRVQGEPRIVLYEKVGINDWYEIVVLPESQILEEAFEVSKGGYVMLGIVSAAVILILFLLIWREKDLEHQARQESERLRYILEHDNLTGLSTELAFQRLVEERLRTREYPYCLVYFDVYKFKLINEMFGWSRGDELISSIADRLKVLTAECGGLAARISGDTFAVLLPDQPEIIERLTTGREGSEEQKLFPIDVYLYYGIYRIHNQDTPVSVMMDCAHIAQKAIKGNYGNYVAYYDAKLKHQILKEQEIVNLMVRALENHEFVVYLQPQYQYPSGCITGAEALVRWNSPERGLIPPSEFIPIFETNGFITKVDEYVWEEVCKLLRKWIEHGKNPIPISINVSRADLYRGSVANKLKQLIDQYRLTTDLLRVEITESAYMDNATQLIRAIEELRSYGFVVEMDDFGSGYSSLNMLKDVPINVLKTDLQFLDSSGIDNRRDTILDNIIHMAHQIGLIVIAEGVETKEQADYLSGLDCETMQGYYFSKPLPVEEFEYVAYKK